MVPIHGWRQLVTASSDSTFSILHALEGQRIKATISYTDDQGFNESINTDAITIPFVDDGDAAFLIQGSPRVGQTHHHTLLDDPDGDGAIDVSWRPRWMESPGGM